MEPLEGKSAEEKRRSERAGQPWQPSEDIELSRRFDAGATIKELALKRDRTTGAVRSRLVAFTLFNVLPNLGFASPGPRAPNPDITRL